MLIYVKYFNLFLRDSKSKMCEGGCIRLLWLFLACKDKGIKPLDYFAIFLNTDSRGPVLLYLVQNTANKTQKALKANAYMIEN